MPGRTTAAKRFAEAIAGIARQEGSWERWRQDLAAITEALKDESLRLALESPRVPFERKAELLDRALGDNVAPQTRNFLKVLSRRSRFNLLPDIATWFNEMSDRELGIRQFSVTSAIALTDREREQLRQRLTPAGGQAVIAEHVDPSLIGGLVLRHEDIIRDYSVRTRLQSLRERLN